MVVDARVMFVATGVEMHAVVESIAREAATGRVLVHLRLRYSDVPEEVRLWFDGAEFNRLGWRVGRAVVIEQIATGIAVTEGGSDGG